MLFLLTTASAALVIYGHPVHLIALFAVVIAVGSFVLGVLALRMHLIVDEDGVAVRFVRHEVWTEWRDIEAVRVVNGVRGAQTVRIERVDRTFVNVPPSLLMPSRPVTKPTGEAILRAIAAQVEACRTAPARRA